MTIVSPVASGTTFVLPDADAAAELLREHGLRVGARRTVDRVRLDTFGRDLRAAGWTLEHRRRTGEPSVVVVRLRDVATWTGPAETIPRYASDLPAGPLTERLVGAIGGRALLPIVSHRAVSRPVFGPGAPGTGPPVAEIGHGVVSGRGTRWNGVIEVAPGATWPPEIRPVWRPIRDGLRALSDTRRRGDLLDLVERVDLPLSPTRPPTRVAPTGRTAALVGFARSLDAQAAVLTATWPGTVADLDPEFLHELRVAVRRTRALLSHGRRVLPDDERARFAAEAAWLNRVTGPTRDLDVLLGGWTAFVGRVPTAERDALEPLRLGLERDRSVTRREMVAHLAGPRATAVPEELGAWAAAGCPGEPGSLARRPLAVIVARRLHAAHRRVVDQGRLIDASSADERLHELRKDAKRLRSIFDGFGPLFAPDDAAAFVRTLRRLQDELGRHQDAAVHAALVEERGAQLADARSRAAATRLAEALRADCGASRTVAVRRFAAFDRPRVERLVDRMADRLTRHDR